MGGPPGKTRRKQNRNRTQAAGQLTCNNAITILVLPDCTAIVLMVVVAGFGQPPGTPPKSSAETIPDISRPGPEKNFSSARSRGRTQTGLTIPRRNFLAQLTAGVCVEGGGNKLRLENRLRSISLGVAPTSEGLSINRPIGFSF
ncbi:hypothetical protein JTE90_002793 [Oedothorax gibbosus]|uniref:Uncharacterized protein n=1 Tax=Oedothorax gibbosus TaxID=931172 RepID=A0AAV6UIX8_9ARAC|nr:hypothetical protein JTE90_002793 [Oedothorax gibbosus]